MVSEKKEINKIIQLDKRTLTNTDRYGKNCPQFSLLKRTSFIGQLIHSEGRVYGK